MISTLTSEKLPIQLWVSGLQDNALEQAKNIANLPFAYHHIAIMPDAHSGYGMPIGAVMATDGFVVPNAVGVDIGCGMCALETNLKYIPGDALRAIMSDIRATIPVGRNHQKTQQEWE